MFPVTCGSSSESEDDASVLIKSLKRVVFLEFDTLFMDLCLIFMSIPWTCPLTFVSG